MKQLEKTRVFHVLNLGAGVQSTYLYLLFQAGKVLGPDGVPVVLDCAIFSDTGEEPRAVYDHLKWLHSLGGSPIWEVSHGVLGDDLMRRESAAGGRFASVPFFVGQAGEKRPGMTGRQCSRDYKIDPIERAIRRQLVGIRPHKWMPKDVMVHQYIGMSFDECRRALRVRKNFTKRAAWSTPHFPLIDMKIARAEIIELLKEQVPHETPRSACTFCPYHTNAEWRHIRDTDALGWARAIEIDHALRRAGSFVNRGIESSLFAHRSCVPLDVADIDTDPTPRENLFHPEFGFVDECQGMCGM